MMFKYLPVLGLACLISSCSKDEPVGVTKYGPTKPDIQMVLTSKRVYSISPEKDSILPGVSVTVYGNSYDRILHQNRVKYGTTDTTGKITFEYLESQEYFVEAVYPGTDTAHITVEFPAGALTSFEDLLMVNH